MSEVKTNKISSLASNNDITIDPDGTGKVAIPAAVEVDSNDITVAFDGADDTNSLILQGSNGSSEKYTFELKADGANSLAKLRIGTSGGSAGDKVQFNSVGRMFIPGVGSHVTGYGGFTGDINVAGSGITTGFGGSSGQFRNMYGSDNGGTVQLNFHNGSSNSYLSTSGAWTDAADQSYKRYITDLTYGIAKVKALQPRAYHLVSNSDDNDPQIGFVAQELETHIPEVVTSSLDKADDTTKKGVAYGRLTAVLTKALQEAIAKIEALEARVTALEDA